MATYAIGDIQGCYQSLIDLLNRIDFKPETDHLWFVGDLINRGPSSLETLRFIRSLPNRQCVLGNHDLHFLGVYWGVRIPHPKDTLDPLLHAPDTPELVDFLRHQPLFYWDKSLGFAMAHAGIHPHWSFDEAQAYSQEIQIQLKDPNQSTVSDFLSRIFGDEPKRWNADLSGEDRHRALINHFTRMRLMDPDLSLRLDYKSTYERRPTNTEAWFRLRNWKPEERLIFGHWAALMGDTRPVESSAFGIDTGCIWGQRLTALRLEDHQTFSVDRAKEDKV